MSAHLDELWARERLHPRTGNVTRLRERTTPSPNRDGSCGDAGPGIDGGPGLGGSVSPTDAPAGPTDLPEVAA